MSTKVDCQTSNGEMVAGERILTRHKSWNASLRLRFRNAEPKWRADNLVPRKQFNHEPRSENLIIDTPVLGAHPLAGRSSTDAPRTLQQSLTEICPRRSFVMLSPAAWASKSAGCQSVCPPDALAQFPALSFRESSVFRIRQRHQASGASFGRQALSYRLLQSCCGTQRRLHPVAQESAAIAKPRRAKSQVGSANGSAGKAAILSIWAISPARAAWKCGCQSGCACSDNSVTRCLICGSSCIPRFDQHSFTQRTSSRNTF